MKRKHLVAVKHLPPNLVTKPARQRARARSEHAERATIVLVIIAAAIIGLLSAPDLTGRATTATTVNITQTVNVNCTIPLTAGLNIISLNCISNSEDRDAVLANTDTAVITAIYEYRNQQADQWRVYNPDLPSYVVQDLSTFSRLKGYLVYVDAGQNTLIDYAGTLASTSSIPVLSDNNLVGYPSIMNDSLPGALTTIQGTYSRVRTYNGSTWLEFNTTDGSAGGLVNMTPTEGYWITMSSSDTWIVAYNNS